MDFNFAILLVMLDFWRAVVIEYAHTKTNLFYREKKDEKQAIKRSLSLSLSANPKHLIRGAFFAAGKVFADFYEKSNNFYHALKRSFFSVNRPNLSKSFLTFGASQFVENPEHKIRFKYKETLYWMLGEFASLKSKHDGGVAKANQQNPLNVIANAVKQSLKTTHNVIVNEVKQSFLHCHCEPKARQSFQLHNNRLPRRYAPRNDDVVASNRLPRRYAPRNDLGRSMIEMLGVLAIIAVLSVGGLAGYSKAMTKFKINKVIEQVTTIVSNTQILFANEKTIPMLDYEVDEDSYIFVRDFIFPKETDTGLNEYGLHNFTHALGGRLWFTGGDNDKSIYIIIESLSKEACIALATNDWGYNYGIAIDYTKNYYGAIVSDCLYPYEADGFTGAGNGWALGCRKDGGLPLTPDKAAIGCSCNDATCTVEIGYDLINMNGSL